MLDFEEILRITKEMGVKVVIGRGNHKIHNNNGELVDLDLYYLVNNFGKDLDLGVFAMNCDSSLSEVYDELIKSLTASYSCEFVDGFLEFTKEYDKQFSTESLERELKSCKNPLRKKQIQTQTKHFSGQIIC